MDSLNQTESLTTKLKSERNPRGSFVFLFLVLLFFDQVTKHFAKNIFRNYNFVFSLPLPLWSMYIIYILVICFCVYYAVKNYGRFSLAERFAWTLIFSGAAANIFERIILGYVRDFIYIRFSLWTGIYNLADGYIIAGILIIFISSFRRKT